MADVVTLRAVLEAATEGVTAGFAKVGDAVDSLRKKVGEANLEMKKQAAETAKANTEAARTAFQGAIQAVEDAKRAAATATAAAQEAAQQRIRIAQEEAKAKTAAAQSEVEQVKRVTAEKIALAKQAAEESANVAKIASESAQEILNGSVAAKQREAELDAEVFARKQVWAEQQVALAKTTAEQVLAAQKIRVEGEIVAANEILAKEQELAQKQIEDAQKVLNAQKSAYKERVAAQRVAAGELAAAERQVNNQLTGLQQAGKNAFTALNSSVILFSGPLSGAGARAAALVFIYKEFAAQARLAAEAAGLTGAAVERAGIKAGLAWTGGIAAVAAFAAVLSEGLKVAIDFEDKMAQLKVITGLPTDQLDKLGNSLQSISKGLGVPLEEVSATAKVIAEAGVEGAESISAFTKTMEEFSRVGHEAGESIQEDAQKFTVLLRLTNTADTEIGKVASTVLDLSRAFSASKSQVLDSANAVARAGGIYGVSAAAAVALGATLKSMGVTAEAGGTAIRRLSSSLQTAALSGGKVKAGLADIFKDTGQDLDQFLKLTKTDMGGAILLLVQNLAKLKAMGGDTERALSGIGISGQRSGKALDALTIGADRYRGALEEANKEIQSGQFLIEAFGVTSETTKRQLEVFSTEFQLFAKGVADNFLPAINTVLKLLNAYFGFNPSTDPLASAKDGVTAFARAVEENRDSIEFFLSISKLAGGAALLYTGHPFLAAPLIASGAKGELDQLRKLRDYLQNEGNVSNVSGFKEPFANIGKGGSIPSYLVQLPDYLGTATGSTQQLQDALKGIGPAGQQGAGEAADAVANLNKETDAAYGKIQSLLGQNAFLDLFNEGAFGSKSDLKYKDLKQTFDLLGNLDVQGRQALEEKFLNRSNGAEDLKGAYQELYDAKKKDLSVSDDLIKQTLNAVRHNRLQETSMQQATKAREEAIRKTKEHEKALKDFFEHARAAGVSEAFKPVSEQNIPKAQTEQFSRGAQELINKGESIPVAMAHAKQSVDEFNKGLQQGEEAVEQYGIRAKQLEGIQLDFEKATQKTASTVKLLGLTYEQDLNAQLSDAQKHFDDLLANETEAARATGDYSSQTLQAAESVKSLKDQLELLPLQQTVERLQDEIGMGAEQVEVFEALAAAAKKYQVQGVSLVDAINKIPEAQRAAIVTSIELRKQMEFNTQATGKFVDALSQIALHGAAPLETFKGFWLSTFEDMFKKTIASKIGILDFGFKGNLLNDIPNMFGSMSKSVLGIFGNLWDAVLNGKGSGLDTGLSNLLGGVAGGAASLLSQNLGTIASGAFGSGATAVDAETAARAGVSFEGTAEGAGTGALRGLGGTLVNAGYSIGGGVGGGYLGSKIGTSLGGQTGGQVGGLVGGLGGSYLATTYGPKIAAAIIAQVSSQVATQAGTQIATQAGTQIATQAATQTGTQIATQAGAGAAGAGGGAIGAVAAPAAAVAGAGVGAYGVYNAYGQGGARGGWGGAASGAGAGAAIGTYLSPGFGTVVGGVLGALVGGLVGAFGGGGGPSKGATSRRFLGDQILGSVPTIGGLGSDLNFDPYKSGVTSIQKAMETFPDLFSKAGGAARVFGYALSSSVKSGQSDAKEMNFIVSTLIDNFGRAGLTGPQALVQIKSAMDSLKISTESVGDALLKTFQEGKLSFSEYSQSITGLDQLAATTGVDIAAVLDGLVSGKATLADFQKSVDDLGTAGISTFGDLEGFLKSSFGDQGKDVFKALSSSGIDDITQLATISQEQLGKISEALQSALGADFSNSFSSLKAVGIDTMTSIGLAGNDAFQSLIATMNGSFLTNAQQVFDSISKSGVGSIANLRTASAAQLSALSKAIGGMGGNGEKIIDAFAKAGVNSFQDLAGLGNKAIESIIKMLGEIPGDVTTKYHIETIGGVDVSVPEGTSAAGWKLDPSNKATGGITWIGSGDVPKIGSGEVENIKKTLASHAQGGIVQGTVGSAVEIMAHAGELIIPTHTAAGLRTFADTLEGSMENHRGKGPSAADLATMIARAVEKAGHKIVVVPTVDKSDLPKTIYQLRRENRLVDSQTFDKPFGIR